MVNISALRRHIVLTRLRYFMKSWVRGFPCISALKNGLFLIFLKILFSCTKIAVYFNPGIGIDKLIKLVNAVLKKELGAVEKTCLIVSRNEFSPNPELQF